MTMTKIMLDLETMGTRPNSAIIAIGAVRFDNEAILDRFHTVIDLESCLRAGLEVDGDTVNWWMKQSDAARAVFQTPGVELPQALTDFATWLLTVRTTEVWGDGAGFDNVLLTNAYQKCNYLPPWPFYTDRCYRTVKAMNPDITSDGRIGVYHNSQDDTETQALHLIKILKVLTK